MGLKRLAIVFAAGYVVGTRAGEKRFKQISDAWDRFLEIPLIQELSDETRALMRNSADRATQSIRRTRDRVSSEPGEGEPQDEAEEWEGEEKEKGKEDEEARPAGRANERTSERSSRSRNSGRRSPSGSQRAPRSRHGDRRSGNGARHNGSSGVLTRARDFVAVARDRGRVGD